MWATRELIAGRSASDVAASVRRRIGRLSPSSRRPTPPPPDDTGLHLPGTVAAEVNPYEQELSAFRERYALTLDEVRAALPQVTVESLDLRRADYLEFLDIVLPGHADVARRVEHKKKLEMFITHSLLRTGPDVAFLDAGGAGYSYIDTVAARERHLQDLVIRSRIRDRYGAGVHYVEHSLDAIPLPDASIDSISCHHAFEHFQGAVDTEFVREAQRVLSPGGRLCIVPLFLSTDHVEMTCLRRFRNWSGGARSVRVVDTTATLPGRGSGGYARIYDPPAFTERVLDAVDHQRFEVAIHECTLEGDPVPNPSVYASHKVSNFNFPYRALTISRRGDA